MNKPWNRSSAWPPEQLAIITTAINKAVQNAVDTFGKAIEGTDLTDEQKAEAIQLVAQGVTDGIAQFLESLKK